MEQNSLSGRGMAAPQKKLSIQDTNEVVCDKCQHNVFDSGIYLRKVSALVSGNGKPNYLPIENVAFYCVKCGHVNDEFIPLELKTNRIVV